MIRPATVSDFLNEVANHPAVRPHVGGDGPIDLTEALAKPGNIGLECDSGGFFLTQHSPGVYEVHSLFLPDNGTKPIRAMRAAQEWMFTRTDCGVILSKVPKANKAAKGFAIAGGLAPIFERDDALLGPCEYVELGVMRWAMRSAYLEAHGERFHAFLEQHKTEDIHPHDPAHERAVGAALLMIERGQDAKGVGFYNSWAMFAGYQTIELLSPGVVDVRDAVLRLGLDNNMELVSCQ